MQTEKDIPNRKSLETTLSVCPSLTAVKTAGSRFLCHLKDGTSALPSLSVSSQTLAISANLDLNQKGKAL
jgi:hypothetical protein